MKRLIGSYLSKWKNSDNRKVLMLRGARQVGKTYAVRELSKKFQFFVEINFELDNDVKFFIKTMPVFAVSNLFKM